MPHFAIGCFSHFFIYSTKFLYDKYSNPVRIDSTLSIHTLFVFLRIHTIIGYYDLCWLPYAGSMFPVMCPFSLLLHYVITIHQRYRRTDGCHARIAYAQHAYTAYRGKK